MNGKYHIRLGIIFSLVLAILSSFPRLIRFDFQLVSNFFVNFGYLFFSLFACWLLHHFFLLKKFRRSFLQHNSIKIIASISSGVALIVLLAYFFNILSNVTHGDISLERMNPFQVISIRVFRGTIVSAFTFFVVYYLRMLLNFQQTRLENEYLKQENLMAQLASLKEQISPHFLFNSLNTLSTLSKDGTVKEYILRMSEVYRYVLHYQELHEVVVKDELDFIKSYTFILESRFEESLKINIRIGADKLYCRILPLSLQLLVENALKHNAISYQKPLQIEIYDQDDMLVVENDFRPKETLDKHSGTGLVNLAQRYRLAVNREIKIDRTTDKFKVEIPFLP